MAMSLFLKTRLTPSLKGAMQYRVLFADSRFTRFFISGLFNSFGYFIPFYFLSIYAVQHGMTSAQGALLVGILNLATGFGRISLGLFADRFGHLKTFILSLFVSAASIILIWPFAKTFVTLSVFALMYGIFVGGYISLAPSTIVTLFGTKNIAAVTGILFSSSAVGNLFGPACAAYILQSTSTTLPNGTVVLDFFPIMLLAFSGFFTGSCIVLSILIWPMLWKQTAPVLQPSDTSTATNVAEARQPSEFE